MYRALTGSMARRVYFGLLCFLLIVAIGFRLHSFLLARKMSAVIAGLSKLQIDQTTEEDVVRAVPYLVRSNFDRDVQRSAETGNVDTGVERVYYVDLNNDANWMRVEDFAWRFSDVSAP